MPNHFLSIKDHSTSTLRAILDAAHHLKKTRGKTTETPLVGKSLALIFERPSTRTRVSFDVAMRELGGETIVLSGDELQIGRGESIADTAKVLSRYLDAIMIRILDDQSLQELAEHATVPVINGLTQLSHPTQIMADLMTVEEQLGSIEGKKITWVGDFNNVTVSWVEAAEKLPFHLQIGCPTELFSGESIVKQAQDRGADISVTSDPEEAVQNANVVMTDTFVSMGDDEAERRYNLLMPYQVNERLMQRADEKALFLHCLPAHRNEEVTDAVMDGPQSFVFDQAENRLHAHKALLLWAMKGL